MSTALEEGEGSASRPGRFLPPEKDSVPIVQEARWTPGLVWTDAENLASTGIRSPDRPARSQSLYRLSYTGPQYAEIATSNTNPGLESRMDFYSRIFLFWRAVPNNGA